MVGIGIHGTLKKFCLRAYRFETCRAHHFMIKHLYLRWKALKELKKSAKWFEKFANELPTSTIREMYPGVDPIDARNNMALQAARLTKIKFIDLVGI